MTVVLQGSLDRFPLSQVLLFLGGNGHSGTLELTSGDERTRIWLDAGTIVAAEAARQRDPREAVLSAFDRRSGDFAFVDTLQIPDDAPRVSLDTSSLVAEAARRTAETFADDLLLRVVDDAESQEEITLSPEELRLLIRIGSGKTFGVLAAESKESRQQLNARIKALVEKQALTTDSAPAAVPARAKQRSGPLIGGLIADSGDVHPLVDAEYTIGRDAANAIAITDSSVSSRHARLTKGSDAFILEDLNSRNGTFVNGDKLTGKHTLKNGDILRFGKIIFTFQLADTPGSDDTHAVAGKSTRES